MLSLTTLMGFLLLPAPAHVAAMPVVPSYMVTLTAYNAVPAQTDNSPFETASGAYSNPAVVAARSRDLAGALPFGTIIEIDGSSATSTSTCGYGVVAPEVGYRVIADTMNVRFTDRIDVLLPTKADYATADKGMQNAAQVLGVCSGVTVRVVGHVAINHIPKTQAALAALVTGNTEKPLALK